MKGDYTKSLQVLIQTDLEQYTQLALQKHLKMIQTNFVAFSISQRNAILSKSLEKDWQCNLYQILIIYHMTLDIETTRTKFELILSTISRVQGKHDSDLVDAVLIYASTVLKNPIYCIEGSENLSQN